MPRNPLRRIPDRCADPVRLCFVQRAEAALIAWLRHQTTGHDEMRIVVDRREVRRRLAEESKALLECYRRGEPIGEECPLRRGLDEKTRP